MKYDIQVRGPGLGQFTVASSTSNATTTVYWMDLVNAVSLRAELHFLVRVVAYNSIGAGDAGDSASAATTAPTLPGVTTLSIAARTGGALTFQWYIPLDTGAYVRTCCMACAD